MVFMVGLMVIITGEQEVLGLQLGTYGTLLGNIKYNAMHALLGNCLSNEYKIK